MQCRSGCGACCISPSISSLNKPAGVPCPHLDAEMKCSLFGRPERPQVCSSLRPCLEMCGRSRQEALTYLSWLEKATGRNLD